MFNKSFGPVRFISHLVVLVGILANNSVVSAQCTNINAPETVAWVNGIIASALGQDNACRMGAPDRDTFASSTACNIFVGRVMARMYGLSDFVDSNGSFRRANQIAALLPTFGNNWVDLGIADNQNVLDSAAKAANLGHVVLAVWANPIAGKPGHVTLIGPGPLTASSSWGLKTPVAASFTLDDVESAFLGQPLACAFGKSKKSTTHLWKYNKVVTPL
jgi:hypothetical protein